MSSLWFYAATIFEKGATSSNVVNADRVIYTHVLWAAAGVTVGPLDTLELGG